MILKNVLNMLNFAHAKRVGQLAEELAEKAGLSKQETEWIGEAAVYHDIGKISLPDTLLRAERPLTDGERKRMQRHVEYGLGILAVYEQSPLMNTARAIVATHHECWDGSGYPNGLMGEEIPLCGRIVALCDVYDALTADRPYKAAWSQEKALEYIAQRKGGSFDPALTDLFLNMLQKRLPVSAL